MEMPLKYFLTVKQLKIEIPVPFYQEKNGICEIRPFKVTAT
jgi:hypothetical protein